MSKTGAACVMCVILIKRTEHNVDTVELRVFLFLITLQVYRELKKGRGRKLSLGIANEPCVVAAVVV